MLSCDAKSVHTSMKFGHITSKEGPTPNFYSYLSKSRIWLNYINRKSKILDT